MQLNLLDEILDRAAALFAAINERFPKIAG